MQRIVTYLYFFVFISLLPQVANAQNLVPNPSFETYTSCPPAQSGIAFATPWDRPPGSITTPDLFHACHPGGGTACSNVDVPNNFGGSANAFHGNGYAGIISYYTGCPNCREYIQAPLTQALAPGATYHVSMRVLLMPWSLYATDRIGIHISSARPNQPSNQPILLVPTYQHPAQITNTATWTLVATNYTAIGGESWVTIGNFYDNAQVNVLNFGSSPATCALASAGAMYVVDSIIIQITSPPVGIQGFNDTTICQGGTATLSASGGSNYWWSTLSQPALQIGTGSPFTISPIVTTSYIVHDGVLADTLTVTVFPVPQINLGTDTTLCPGQSLLLNASSPGATGYFWNDGFTNPIRTIFSPGLWWVEATNGTCTFRDSILISFQSVPSLNLGPDATLCAWQSITLDASLPGATGYLWNDGITTPARTINTAGSWWVEVSFGNCSVRDSIQLTFLNPPPVNLGPDLNFCPGNTLSLNASTPGGVSYLWNDGLITPQRPVPIPGQYWVEVDFGGCVSRDTIQINWVNFGPVNLGADHTICAGDSLTLDATLAGAVSYLWNGGHNGPTMNVFTGGTFSVQVSNGLCTVRDTVLIRLRNLAAPTLGPDSTICEGESLPANAVVSGAVNYLWSDGNTNMIRYFTTSGTWWAEATDGICTTRDTITLTVVMTDPVDLGPDQILCQGDSLLLDATQSGNATYSWSGPSGPGLSNSPSLFISSGGQFSVSVLVEGRCQLADQVNISVVEPILMELGADTILCGSELKLSGPAGNHAFLWSSGESGQEITVKESGLYWLQVSNFCETLADTLNITLLSAGIPYFQPNAFSPNKDGINDEFKITVIESMTDFELRIFDRWGNLIWLSSNPNFHWDGRDRMGKDLPEGVYTVFIRFDQQCSTGLKTLGTTLTLIR